MSTGGGITVHGTVGSTVYHAELPWTSAWVVKIDRQTSEAVSLAGSVIRQAASKSQTAGTATYSGLALEAEAIKIRTLDEGATQVYVSDGSRVYLAIMDAIVSRSVKGGKCKVEASFRMIRKVIG
jgi:hypothetical protein